MCSQRHRSERPHSRAAWMRAGGGWVGSYTHTPSLTKRDPGQQEIPVQLVQGPGGCRTELSP